jgi:extracellular factor (EF) 3-hydroxypalmitic acid methyl ester biosynthesis protein
MQRKVLHGILDRAEHGLTHGNVSDAFNGLVRDLFCHKQSIGAEEFHCIALPLCRDHRVSQLLWQDPYTLRALAKPRGYAGDAVLIDFFYGYNGPDEADTTLGKDIFAAAMKRSASESVRYRCHLVANKIDEVARHHPGARVLSVASGHLREAAISEAIQRNLVHCLIALDQDEKSVNFVRSEFQDKHLPIEPLCGSIRSILTRKLRPGPLDFAYAAGLYDYLEAPLAARLTARMFEMLDGGGRLLVANFAPEIEEQGYMEAFMDWRLIYRDEVSVAAFAQEIPEGEIADRKLYRDPHRNVIYLELVKR